jgi:hypothetical protein
MTGGVDVAPIVIFCDICGVSSSLAAYTFPAMIFPSEINWLWMNVAFPAVRLVPSKAIITSLPFF